MAGTYTMRGEEYEFAPPTAAEDLSRLVWLANRVGDWGTQAITVLWATRDAERIITLSSGARWKVEGRKDAAGRTTWVAERLPELVVEPASDAGIAAHLAAGQELSLVELAYLIDSLDKEWHPLAEGGEVRGAIWERETLKRLYVERRASSTTREQERLGYIDLVTSAAQADGGRAALAAAVAALLAGANLDPDAAIEREAADIARVQALILAHRAALDAEARELADQVAAYSFRSKSVIKGGKARTMALLEWALLYATRPVEELTSPQVATLYKVARVWELEEAAV